ncbi:NHL repeat-containing protein [Roseiconus lacunae]|uniref:Ice-binding protein C-terminal domain-containing protein n=1 Tax=Roseiconus lacunae TaxID=2605694 RepID=A0ABT7PIX0_9BACT|nr:hypothetical protein [Roseiconus lacunae]MCD0458319.1 hypothetical protein [Roseiconus lacunae]MDM4016211.1 hypothetical protein [Roseiconus lacunae]
MHRRGLAKLVGLFLLFSCISNDVSGELTTGNLIVSINEFTGLNTAPSYVAEYTTAGTRVQTFQEVPDPASGSSTDHARDLVYLNGAVYVHNSNNSPSELLRISPATPTASWEETIEFAGWDTDGFISTGGLEAFNNYLFATDSQPASNGGGIVRFNLLNGSAQRLNSATPTTDNPYDLNLDVHGNLYTINNRVSDQIDVYDSESGDYLRSITISFDQWRSIDVASDGSIFVGNTSGELVRFSSDGSTMLDSIQLQTSGYVGDIDINDQTGEIAATFGQLKDSVFLTDQQLGSFTSFRVTDSNAGSRNLFVSWVGVTAIPEPSSGLLCAGLSMAVLLRRRR